MDSGTTMSWNSLANIITGAINTDSFTQYFKNTPFYTPDILYRIVYIYMYILSNLVIQIQ